MLGAAVSSQTSGAFVSMPYLSDAKGHSMVASEPGRQCCRQTHEASIQDAMASGMPPGTSCQAFISRPVGTEEPVLLGPGPVGMRNRSFREAVSVWPRLWL